MFEIVIFGVIFLAACYWAVLWLMGRRDDVLHGEFVRSEPHGGEQARPVVAARPEFPPRPAPPKAALPQPAFRQERLDSLLDEIKQDLTQLVMRK
jgi:hypothetical protein